MSVNREEAALHLQIGTGYFKNGKYPQALNELLLAEKQDPQNALVQNNLGLVYFVREKYDLAEEHMRRALKINPNYTEALNNLARIEIELSRFDEALGELNKVLADLTYSNVEKAWVNIGLAYFRKGEYATARDKLTEAIRINRQNCLANTLYGRALMELGDLQKAATTLDNSVSLCKGSEFDEPHYYSGICYSKLGQNEKAMARMEEVIKLYPYGKFAKRAKSMLEDMGLGQQQ